MPRHPDTKVVPNDLLAGARRRMPSPHRGGQHLSRTELADAVNATLYRLYPGRDLATHYVNSRWIGKLERGEHRWPSDERRAALREVLNVDTDKHIGLYSPRRSGDASTQGQAPWLIPPRTALGGGVDLPGVPGKQAGQDRPHVQPMDPACERIPPTRAGAAPEGLFLGSEQVIIATPLKEEAIKARPVVAVEDVAAAQRLGELARSLGLQPSYEHIPADGAIDLNRSNLVVICGPRLSKPVAEVLAQDGRLQFERATDGPWTLIDRSTGTVHRSGQDQDPPTNSDVAYFGRLPRPDGQGSLIVFTGIHPPGSLGVAHLICTQIAELYARVNNANFSALVGTEGEPGTTEPQRVKLLTPLYQLEER